MPRKATVRPGTRPDIARSNVTRSQALVHVSEAAMVEHALGYFYNRSARGRRVFPTDMEIVTNLQVTYGIPTAKAVAVLRGMKVAIAERVNAVMPTMAQSVINDLSEEIQAARSKGDHGAAIRGLLGLGRFVGLDQPQVSPDQQVRQLSDAALDAALSSSIARSLETMSDDAFADLMRRREAKRLADAKPADPPPPDPKPLIDATSTEG